MAKIVNIAARAWKRLGRANVCDREKCSSRLHALTAVFIIASHSVILAHGACCHSPAWDEIGHLPSGIAHWRTGAFHLYRVNPPLVRMVAAVPVLFADADEAWLDETAGFSLIRREWEAGREFIDCNGELAQWYFTIARWACIPFSVFGAIASYRWSRDLFDRNAGLLAMALWCYSPNIIAHGQMVTPDVGAASLGVVAHYSFWKWLHAPSGAKTLAAGALLGLMLLTKTTWCLAFLAWPALFVAFQLASPELIGDWRSWAARAVKLFVILCLGVYILNVGYGFEGTAVKLGDYEFRSETLAGSNRGEQASTMNQFRGSWLENIPVPLPANYVLGIDVQKADFESGFSSYLRGEWRNEGWWYYYVYAALVKEPLGTWLLFATSIIAFIRCARYRRSFRDELCLAVPGLVLMVFVSSQTGFNHHFRYVLPALPFAYIWISRVVQCVGLRQRLYLIPVAIGISWSIISSLACVPHSLSYFNELAGGPRYGHRHLLNSNLDWGQDLLQLKWWIEEHSEDRPPYIAYSLPVWLVEPEDYLIPSAGAPPVAPAAAAPSDEIVGPVPGRHAVFAGALFDRDRRYDYFLRFEPVAMVGYTVYIYDISPEEANRVRRDLGLPLLDDSSSPKVIETTGH